MLHGEFTGELNRLGDTIEFAAELSPGSVPLRLDVREPSNRCQEPVSCGLPWPKGEVQTTRQLQLLGSRGQRELLQAHVLDRWSDGSIRWCLVDFLADTSDEGKYRIQVVPASERCREPLADQDVPTPPAFTCGKLGLVTYDRRGDRGSNLLSVRNLDWAEPVELVLELSLGSTSSPCTSTVRWQRLEHGPVRTRIGFKSETVDCLELFGHIDLFASTPVVRVQLTVRNVLPAEHPGGNWDLGNAGSIFLHDLSVSLRFPDAMGRTAIRCSAERGSPMLESTGLLTLYQDSSGGENWKHHTHLNKDHIVTHRFRGYRLQANGQQQEGLRSTPVVTAEKGEYRLGVAMPRFWENFPKAIEADDNGLTLHLLPKQTASGHELQGGEQKTHEFYLLFGEDAVTDESLAWCRSPLLVSADPEWYANTRAMPYLTPAHNDPHPVAHGLARQAIEGDNTFFTKREAIDEYGWRNYGDVYADHEAVYHTGPTALVSHYNNQFDVVRGCAIQFLRSGDARWWDLLIPAADHTCDIDVYHTDCDKPGYNGGLFWQTFHYNDADTGTHRSYPRSLRGPGFQLPGRDLTVMGQTGQEIRALVASGVGGGPGASHNYNQGLMLAYFLTGNPIYRETAIGLAEYVMRLDAPRAVFRFFSGEFSGDATASGSADYHGPGRASANSILALLVGHRLTGRSEFVEKAEQIIRRVSHPRQDLEALNLRNAELRWFYTMHLQALGEYLDHKEELGELDRMYDYARQTLLHFAHWMAEHERPYLDRAENLQYPNETWVAQELRKVEAFQFAAKHAEGEEKRRLLERADWFYRYVEQSLPKYERTKSLCRPVNLVMNFGWSRAWWQRNPETNAPRPSLPASQESTGEWRMFIPQKVRAIRRAKRILCFSVLACLIALLAVLIAGR